MIAESAHCTFLKLLASYVRRYRLYSVDLEGVFSN